MNTKSNKNKKWYAASNIIYGILIASMLLLVMVPDAKSWAIRGLMKIGLFQPDITPQTSNIKNAVAVNELNQEVIFENGAGKKVSLSSLKGKVVFINFWATWCPPCRAEMPTINKLYENLKDEENIVFLMVDPDESFKKAQGYMDKNDFELPVYIPSGPVPPVFLAGALPTTVILDKEGKMAIRHEGAADYSNPEVEKLLRELMK